MVKREDVIKRAEKFVARGKVESAISEYEKILDQDPQDANTLNRVGDLYVRIGRQAEAVKLFVRIAEHYSQSGFYVKAIAIYKKVVRVDPSFLYVYPRLAELYRKQGLIDEARTQYRVLADFYLKRESYSDARSILRQMVDMEPTHWPVRLELLRLEERMGGPQISGQEHHALADSLLRDGMEEELEQFYYDVIESNSAKDVLFVLQALKTLRSRSEVAALKLLEKAIELNPEVGELVRDRPISIPQQVVGADGSDEDKSKKEDAFSPSVIGSSGSPNDGHSYDVFLSHSSKDKPFVEDLARRLTKVGIQPFLDRWHLVPGEAWQEGLEDALERSRTCAVFLGPGGLGPWQNEEMRDALDERAQNSGFRVIPVLLPNAAMPARKALPRFLKRLTWVDFRGGIADSDAFHRFECGIRGLAPGPGMTSRFEYGEPDYLNEETKTTAEQLRAAYETLHEQASAEQDTTEIRQKILTIRRKLREGGLKAGDFLADGRFQLIRKVGRGGFAGVWKAYDRKTTLYVAIKVLHLQYSEDQTRRERFARGALRMAELQHPNIVRVREECQEDGGYHFFVMEYVPGGDLLQAVKKGSLKLEDRWRIILQVGDALQYAHEHGIIHRDIKPANILLGKGFEAKLTDFDLVRAAETTGGTRTGAMGTFVYAAPEMLHRPQDAEPTVDVYGLGMTAIFALYGGDLPPHVFRDAEGFLKQLEDSSSVAPVLAKAVDWEVADRWPTARAFCSALREVLEGTGRGSSESKILSFRQ